MNRLVLDIETIGIPVDDLAPGDREEVDRWASMSDDPDRVYGELALNPLTGRIVAIGMLNPETGRGRVYHQPEHAAAGRSADGLAEFVPGSEADILAAFWQDVAAYDQLITFNGRNFDVPFIHYRSAAHRVAAQADFMQRRYASERHCDLMDQLSFYGTVRPWRSLHFYCRLFGIKSSKDCGVHGGDVGGLWTAGQYAEISEYCWRDVQATAEIFAIWSEFIKPSGKR